MRTFIAVLLSALVVCSLLGCKKPVEPVVKEQPNFDWQLPKGKLGLAKLTNPAEIPDFTTACADLTNLKFAVNRSINYMSKPSSRDVYRYYEPVFTHAKALATLQAFAALLDSGMSPEQMNTAIREKFDVYTSVGWNGFGDVLFTGYYTPIFNASPTKTGKFTYPLYKAPAGLVKSPDGTVAPWKSRQEIESTNACGGQELYYLGDPFEVYIAHVQGSAKLRLPDGKLITVGYSAYNGHEYVSIGKIMLEEGKVPKGGLSLRAMIEYFKQHPDEITRYTWKNPRFVFFNEQANEPHGSLNEPVTAWRSIATDKAIFPRASVTFLSCKLPKRTGNQITSFPYTGWFLDQDAGGAIRAPGRCDVYMGIGDDAGELAGRTAEQGRLYYLLLKDGQ